MLDYLCYLIEAVYKILQHYIFGQPVDQMRASTGLVMIERIIESLLIWDLQNDNRFAQRLVDISLCDTNKEIWCLIRLK